MKKATSLYLDLARFGAALMVFFAHVHHFIGRLFWQAEFYTQTAVMVFFVLSGYVIAHVTNTREFTCVEYSASRFARLYSVVLPALLLTALCDYLISKAVGGLESNGAIGYLATLFFINRFWLWPNLEAGTNLPFWSLSFEACYYVAIGLCLFAKGYVRVLGLILLSAVAGPSIILLAPVWFFCYGAYHLSRRSQLSLLSGLGLWTLTMLLLPICHLIEQDFFQEHYGFFRTEYASIGGLLAEYAAGICFAVNLFAFNAFAHKAIFLLAPFTNIIRWLGSMTFALYLFQYPLVLLLSVYPLGEPTSWIQRIWLVGGTWLVIATLGHLCEQSKGAYKRWFLSVHRLALVKVARNAP
jgi:peptidoglycan/LPS O-acetylase OafA/YrhL